MRKRLWSNTESSAPLINSKSPFRTIPPYSAPLAIVMSDIKSYLLSLLGVYCWMNSYSQVPSSVALKPVTLPPTSIAKSTDEQKLSVHDEPYLSISGLKDKETKSVNSLRIQAQPSSTTPVANHVVLSEVIPPGLLNNVDTMGPRSGHFELVGLFLSPDNVRAEVSIAGKSHFYQVGDLLNQDWVIELIDSSGIQVSRCKARPSKCEFKRVQYVGGLEP